MVPTTALWSRFWVEDQGYVSGMVVVGEVERWERICSSQDVAVDAIVVV